MVKVAVFTLLVPGFWVALVPYLLLEDPSLAAIDVLATSMLGALPLLLGVALYLRCAHDFVFSGRGTPVPIDPPVELVTRGPYRYSRNPMYLGVLAILLGEALLYRQLPLLYLLFAVAVLFHLIAVLYEEPALGRKFGDAYERYRRSVPRWIPTGSALEALYRATFLKVGAFVLVAGAVAHALRLSVGLPVEETPLSLHSFLVVLPAYGVVGCLVYWRRLDLAAIHQKVIFGLATGLLLTTVVVHAYSIVARDNEWYRVFPMWYSALSVVVYAGFAYFLKTRRVDGGRPANAAV